MNLLVCTFAVILLLAISVIGQEQAQTAQTKMLLEGVVYDTNGAVIFKAGITATGRAGEKFTAHTDDEGRYKINLPLALYKVEADAAGFCPSRIDKFRIVQSTHGKMSLDFVLEVRALKHVGDNKRRIYVFGCDTDNEHKKSEGRKNKELQIIE